MPTLPTVERRTIELAGLAVPFVEVTGAAGGPTLTVIAGVHGCEYASMDGVRRWLRTLEGRELRGRVRASAEGSSRRIRARSARRERSGRQTSSFGFCVRASTSPAFAVTRIVPRRFRRGT